MNICITAEGPSLDAKIDPRFGRCRYFIFVDIETMKFQAIENKNLQASGGAGIQSGQLMASNQIEAVLTGNVGPNAFQTLQAAGIEIFTGVSGTISEVLEKYKEGAFKKTQGPTVNAKKRNVLTKKHDKEVGAMPNKDGTGPRGQGAGRGQGTGRGQGAGRGGGRGMGRAMGGGRSSACATGYCVCPECGFKASHQVGFPCSRESCPECGTKMIRE
jgi:predicted Fe-Mo cluster-binding NifX family protein